MTNDPVSRLERLSRLYTEGCLTAPEFRAARALVLGASESGGDRSGSPGGDLERLLTHIRGLGPPDDWAPQTTYPCIPLALVDSVWSLSVKYQGVLNVIARLDDHATAHGVDLATLDTSGFVALVDQTGGPEALAGHVANRQRTTSRDGILKA